MAFVDQFKHLLDVAIDFMPDTVIYTPSGGSAKEITAIITSQEIPESGGQTSKIRAKILLKASDVAAPQYRDKVEFNGQLYSVEFIRSTTPEYFEIDLRREEKLRL